MKTKLYLLLSLFFLGFVVNAQNQDKQLANSIARNMLVYQMLNDFSTVVPVFFVVPGWYVFGSFQVTHIPVFVDEAYYSNADMNNRKNLLHKELYEAFSINFFPEIPDDKQMEVRVTDKSRLLYRLRFYRQEDTLVVLQISGKNLDEKRFNIAQGELVEIIKKDKYGVSYQKSEYLGDTLKRIHDYDSKKDVFFQTEIRFSGDQLDTKSTFRQKGQGKLKLISTEKYIYINKLLSSVENRNRNGSLIDSTYYLHNLDNKIVSMSKKGFGDKGFNITYSFNNKGFMDKKTIRTGNSNYSLEYYRDNGRISGFLINGLNKSYNNELILDFNLQNQLSRIQHKKKYKEMLTTDKTEEMLFNYHSNGNIESIRIIDLNGKISKEINFEYDYFSL